MKEGQDGNDCVFSATEHTEDMEIRARASRGASRESELVVPYAAEVILV